LPLWASVTTPGLSPRFRNAGSVSATCG
jgi:hypothetical protein